MTTESLKDRIITAITDAIPDEWHIRDEDFANAADNVIAVYNKALLESIHISLLPGSTWSVDQDQMIDLVGVECANVMISEGGHRVWVCTENGTVLRIKAKNVTLDDRRINKEADGD